MAATIDEVFDALLDNADFEEVGSVTKAKAFETAAVRYLFYAPQGMSDQGSSLTQSVQQIENLLNRARSYIKENATATASTTSVRFLSAAEGFRR